MLLVHIEVKKPLDTNIPMLGHLRILAVTEGNLLAPEHIGLHCQNKMKNWSQSVLASLSLFFPTFSLESGRREEKTNFFLNQQSKSYDCQKISISTCLLNKTSRPRHMLSSSLTRVDLKVMTRCEPYRVFMRIRWDNISAVHRMDFLCCLCLPLLFILPSSSFFFVLLCFFKLRSVWLKRLFFPPQLFILRFQNFNNNKSQNGAMDSHIAFTQI